MDLLYFFLVIIAVEILLGIFYYIITPSLIRSSTLIDIRSLSKGIVERMFLLIALINDYPHALTLFGTLKLATRLKRGSEDDKIKDSTFNDFYLFGNFISITIAIFYVCLYKILVR